MPVTFGTKTALAVASLQNLGNAAYWQSAAINNATVKAEWGELFIGIETTTTAGSGNGVVDVYLAKSVDGGTVFAGGASGTEGVYTDTANVDPDNLLQVGSIPIDASEVTARVYAHHLAIYDLPEHFAVVLRGTTGTALGVNSNTVAYRLNTFAAA